MPVWLGVAGRNAAPALSWRLNGTPINPRSVRPLTLVRPNGSVFTGFFEIAGVAPDSEYEVEVIAGGERILRNVRTAPAKIPYGPQDSLNVLLVSCFHRLEDKTGLAGKIISQMKVKPHLSIFAGDQVYLDLPTIRDFKDDANWLAEKFENDYVDNWFGDRADRAPGAIPPGFPQVLSQAAGVFSPDDHEYWNNYPFTSPFIQNSWTSAGRRRWKDAAELTYKAFQQSAPPYGQARILDVEPLSIFVLDTRSQRDSALRTRANDLLGAAGRQALSQWAAALVQSAASPTPRFGMLVTGQSLFRSAVGNLRGKIADFEFADYAEDYGFMVGELEKVSHAGLPVLCATGDVHWGRLLIADDPAGKNAGVYEVISSPLSLVSTVFADQASLVWGAVKRGLGGKDSWPRHSDAENPPPRFGTSGEYSTRLLPRVDGGNGVMRGNHVAMLRFMRAGAGLDVEVRYYPLHPDDAVNATEQWSATFKLRARK